MDDLNSLLNSDPSGTTTEITNQLSQIMAWLIIPSIILTIVIIVLYIMHLSHRRKMDNAILEIRDILREMQHPTAKLEPVQPAETTATTISTAEN